MLAGGGGGGRAIDGSFCHIPIARCELFFNSFSVGVVFNALVIHRCMCVFDTVGVF